MSGIWSHERQAGSSTPPKSTPQRVEMAVQRDLGPRTTPGTLGGAIALLGRLHRPAGLKQEDECKPPRIADEPMGPFEVANCVVPRRLTALIEKFLRDQLTGNIQLNIKDGKILGAHIEEFLTFKSSRNA